MNELLFVDTGAWFAAVVPWDANHAAATAWLLAEKRPLLTTDYIVDETLTLLKARGEIARAIQLGHHFFQGTLATVHYLTPDDLHEGWHIFCGFPDKDWSFTDCTSKAIMEKLGITSAFAFDQHFRQFGTVVVVP